MSPFNASMVLFPAILLSCVIAPLAGRIYDKKGGRVLLPLGFLCIGSSLFSGIFGLFASEAQGFSAVGFLATAFAAVGLILAVYITRD